MQPKWIVGLVLGALMILFIFQNTAVVEIRFLFWTFAMSRAILFILLAGAGLAAGWLLHNYWDFSRK